MRSRQPDRACAVRDFLKLASRVESIGVFALRSWSSGSVNRPLDRAGSMAQGSEPVCLEPPSKLTQAMVLVLGGCPRGSFAS